ncbi:MAG: hypothetical protein ACRC1H_04330, partial [Caldilineaceae bacterium]
VRHEWFNRRSPGNLLRPAIYTLIAALVVIGGGWLLLGGETSLALSSLRVNSLRPPWQSLWALLDGYWGFGWVPLDMRNLDGLERTLWQSRLPWPAITVGFLALYLWLYTRRYDWARVRTVVAFTGVSAIWLFLYSKGWSPQFLVWVLAFLALLMPTPRGIALALALSAVNVVEAYVYLILLPDARWLLVGTVLLRTLLLLAVATEFLTQIWPPRVARSTVFADEPRGRGPAAVRATSWALVAATVIAALVATPFAATAYGARRLAEHPCRAAVEFLRAEAVVSPNRTLAMTQIEIWRALYPWLRDDYTLRVVDGYTSNDRPVDAVISERLAAFAGTREFWWLTAAGEESPWSAPSPDPRALPFLMAKACGYSSRIGWAPARSSAWCGWRTRPPWQRPMWTGVRFGCCVGKPEPLGPARRCHWCYTGRPMRPWPPATRSLRNCWMPTAHWLPSRIICLWAGWHRRQRGSRAR